MFFTKWGHSAPTLERCGLNGTSREAIVKQKIVYPYGVAVDIPSQHVYWVDTYLDFVERVDYDGRNRKTIKKGHPVGFILWSFFCCNSPGFVRISTYFFSIYTFLDPPRVFLTVLIIVTYYTYIWGFSLMFSYCFILVCTNLSNYTGNTPLSEIRLYEVIHILYYKKKSAVKNNLIVF